VSAAIRQWLDAAAELEPELLQSPPLTTTDIDAAVVALNAGGHLRLVVDLHPLPGDSRLRVRVIERGCAWWLSDSWGRVAPAMLDAAPSPTGDTVS
jgi:hypothetical protein